MDQYVTKERIGSGSFGIVFKVTHRGTNEKMAMKKIADAFDVDHGINGDIFRECVIQCVLDHPNIAPVHEIIVTPTDICIITDLMDLDLERYIYRMRRMKKKIGHDLIKSYTKQLLQALAYLHKNNIMHRDLKPSNILINKVGDLQLTDFGMSCVFVADQEQCWQVTTLWYRAPEVLAQEPNYTPAVDMWAVGLIVAEMFLQTEVLKGRDDEDQLEKTSRVNEILSKQKGLPDIPAVALNLILRCLTTKADKRITAQAALQHPWFFT